MESVSESMVRSGEVMMLLLFNGIYTESEYKKKNRMRILPYSDDAAMELNRGVDERLELSLRKFQIGISIG
jgi:hypothetical protein